MLKHNENKTEETERNTKETEQTVIWKNNEDSELMSKKDKLFFIYSNCIFDIDRVFNLTNFDLFKSENEQSETEQKNSIETTKNIMFFLDLMFKKIKELDPTNEKERHKTFLLVQKILIEQIGTVAFEETKEIIKLFISFSSMPHLDCNSFMNQGILSSYFSNIHSKRNSFLYIFIISFFEYQQENKTALSLKNLAKQSSSTEEFGDIRIFLLINIVSKLKKIADKLYDHPYYVPILFQFTFNKICFSPFFCEIMKRIAKVEKKASLNDSFHKNSFSYFSRFVACYFAFLKTELHNMSKSIISFLDEEAIQEIIFLNKYNQNFKRKKSTYAFLFDKTQEENNEKFKSLTYNEFSNYMGVILTFSQLINLFENLNTDPLLRNCTKNDLIKSIKKTLALSKSDYQKTYTIYIDIKETIEDKFPSQSYIDSILKFYFDHFNKNEQVIIDIEKKTIYIKEKERYSHSCILTLQLSNESNYLSKIVNQYIKTACLFYSDLYQLSKEMQDKFFVFNPLNLYLAFSTSILSEIEEDIKSILLKREKNNKPTISEMDENKKESMDQKRILFNSKKISIENKREQNGPLTKLEKISIIQEIIQKKITKLEFETTMKKTLKELALESRKKKKEQGKYKKKRINR